MTDEFLTVQEVSDFLKVNPQTVYNWLDRGELGSVRVGKRRRRIRQADVDAFIAAGSQPAAQPEGQESAGDGSESAGAVDSPLVETADGLDGMDRTEIVSALDALSEAARRSRIGFASENVLETMLCHSAF